MIFQHVFADLSLDGIEFLLENRHLLDGFEVDLHLLLAESLDLEVAEQQHDEVGEEAVHLDVLLDGLQLLAGLRLVALDVAAQTGEHPLLPRVQLHQLQLHLLLAALQVLQLLLVTLPHLVTLQEGLNLPLLLLHVEVDLLELQRSHQLLQLPHQPGQPLIAGLVENELTLSDLVAVDGEARLLVLRQNVVEEDGELLAVCVFGLDETQRHLLEVLASEGSTTMTGRIFLR
jgi:hypothetical protein